LFQRPPAADAGLTGRPHIHADQRPALIYAIGDIHGCFAELERLEHSIVADAAEVEGEKWIVTLGDYIDRGPASAQVVRHLMAPPPAGFRRISLAGNHEQMLLDFLADPRRGRGWLDYGGLDTARSYGLGAVAGSGNPGAIARALDLLLPEEHVGWMRGLPSALAVPGFVFVHAGLRPGIPLDQQSEHDLLWIRDEFLDADLPDGPIVVHGHTPAAEPSRTPRRIGIDTGAFASGILTAVRIDAAGETRFLSTGSFPSN
jgi:serine/threonine protein phosphatase 1